MFNQRSRYSIQKRMYLRNFSLPMELIQLKPKEEHLIHIELPVEIKNLNLTRITSIDAALVLHIL